MLSRLVYNLKQPPVHKIAVATAGRSQGFLSCLFDFAFVPWKPKLLFRGLGDLQPVDLTLYTSDSRAHKTRGGISTALLKLTYKHCNVCHVDV